MADVYLPASTPDGLENLRRLLAQATPQDWQDGCTWYDRAHAEARKLADKYGLSLRTVAAVIAALSPRRKWERNVDAADKLIAAWQRDPRDYRKAGIELPNGWRPLRQAYAVLNGADLRGRKCNDFARAIADPQADVVVVDSHIAQGYADRIGGGTCQMAPSLYDRIAQGIRTLAHEAGVLVAQMQAVIWLVIRRLKGEK